MAFAAQQDTVPSLAWILVLANLLWTVAYDTMYAMADRPDDIKIGVKSTAIWFGQYDRIANLSCQALSLMVLYLLGRYLGFNGIFYLGLSVAAGTAMYQYWLCRQRDRVKCFRAFCNNNWFGGSIFAGIVPVSYTHLTLPTIYTV